MQVEHRKRAYDGLTCVWVKNGEFDSWRIAHIYDADAIEGSQDVPATIKWAEQRKPRA